MFFRLRLIAVQPHYRFHFVGRIYVSADYTAVNTVFSEFMRHIPFFGSPLCNNFIFGFQTFPFYFIFGNLFQNSVLGYSVYFKFYFVLIFRRILIKITVAYDALYPSVFIKLYYGSVIVIFYIHFGPCRTGMPCYVSYKVIRWHLSVGIQFFLFFSADDY